MHNDKAAWQSGLFLLLMDLQPRGRQVIPPKSNDGPGALLSYAIA